MKKLILILFLPIVLNAQILTLFVNDSPLTYADTAKTYYVDGVGTGDTLATIAEVNALTLNPADQVLFKRGVTWRERLIVHNSGVVNYPIVIGAYGTGADPIIDGQSTLSSSLTWVDKGNSVFGAYTNYGLSTVFNVTEDGIPLSNMVDGYTGSATNISGNGQWTYNDASDTVFVRTNNGVNPSSVDIAMTRFQATIHLGYSWATKVDYVTVENLDIRGSYYNITIYGKGVTIQNCDLKGTYSACVKIYADYPADPDNPVHITKAQDILVYNNDMQTFGENGVDNTGGEDVTIQGNTIHNSVANRGYADSGTKANGIMTKNYAVNTVIEYNKIYDMERARFGAIMVGGQTGSGWDKESVNVTVKYNLIYNITNLADGSAPSYIIALMAAHDAKIYNNTITNCIVQGSGSGTSLINFDLSRSDKPAYDTENPIIKNNIFYNNKITTGYLVNESANGDVKGLVMDYNLFDANTFGGNLVNNADAFVDTSVAGYGSNETTNSLITTDKMNGEGAALFIANEGAYDAATLTVSGLIVDSLYYIECWARGNNYLKQLVDNFDLGGTLGSLNIGYPRSNWGKVYQTFTATKTSGTLYLYSAAGSSGVVGDSLLIDNLYIGLVSSLPTEFKYENSNYANLTAWQSAGFDGNSIQSSPMFTDSLTTFTLQPGSPAINAGTDVGLTQDILGNPIVGLPDIGAFEKQ